MKKAIHFKFILVLCLTLFLFHCNIKKAKNPQPNYNQKTNYSFIRIVKATGNLRLNNPASTPTYEIYFHIPIAFEGQVPIYLKIESPALINYRFLRLAPPNVIVVATMQHSNATEVNWESWVMTRSNSAAVAALPPYVQIPTASQLPTDTLKWLQSTSCVQVDNPIVQDKALELRGDTDNLRTLSQSIANYCHTIPYSFPHNPISFSAVYTLRWGNSCTGHAHAGAALLRANGVPSRVLLNILTGYSRPMDMHWIVDYYIPEYGWFKMETTQGLNIFPPDNTVVVMVCEPEYENPLFYPSGLDTYWYSSDPVADIPGWGGAHSSRNVSLLRIPQSEIDELLSLSESIWEHYIDKRGINLSSSNQSNLDSAYNLQYTALTQLRDSQVENVPITLSEALQYLEKIELKPVQTIFFDDFEHGINGWTHGGVEDEWELGSPFYGDNSTINAYSGDNCWATDLDGDYENNADNWLMSPVINLENLSCAYLSVNILNSLDGDDQQHEYLDPLWLEITTDGRTFIPLCSSMGGVNDDPEIFDKGGWSFLALDLYRYIGHNVQVRFRMSSNSNITHEGVHIDNFRIYGRNL